MPRLLIGDTWYSRAERLDLSEREYQELVTQRADLLYPEFWVVPVGMRIDNDFGACWPHFAFIEKRYRAWMICLLQIGAPPANEVLARLLSAVRGHRYGQEWTEALLEQKPSIDRGRLQGLLQRDPPTLYLIARDGPLHGERPEGVRVGLAEVFISNTGQHAIRVNGESPEIPMRLLAVCRRNPLMGLPALFLGALEEPEYQLPTTCEIEVNGVLEAWDVRIARRAGGRTLLVPSRPEALPSGVEQYQLFHCANGRLVLRPQIRG